MTRGAEKTADRTGSLDELPLSRLLFSLYRRQFSGLVTLTQGIVEQMVYLRDGLPVVARVTEAVDTSACIFLAQGWIGQAEFDLSLARGRATGERQSDVLAAMGVVSARQLAQARKQQLLQKIIQLFRLTRASFAVLRCDHEHARTREELARLRVHPRRVIYEGVRASYDAARVLREAGAELAGMRFTIPPARAASLGRYRFGAADGAMIRELTACPLAISHLRESTGATEAAALRLLYVLWVTELVELRPDEPTGDWQARPVATPVPVATALANSAGTYRFTTDTLPPECRSERIRIAPPSAPPATANPRKPDA